ncbi:MAG: hypothetical protein SV186_01195 [Candidatus Nanohaloarchaea archaeon]|nr:hypothetical protein [Candidatus Nanohaloarchaea archaeon]
MAQALDPVREHWLLVSLLLVAIIVTVISTSVPGYIYKAQYWDTRDQPNTSAAELRSTASTTYDALETGKLHTLPSSFSITSRKNLIEQQCTKNTTACPANITAAAISDIYAAGHPYLASTAAAYLNRLHLNTIKQQTRLPPRTAIYQSVVERLMLTTRTILTATLDCRQYNGTARQCYEKTSDLLVRNWDTNTQLAFQRLKNSSAPSLVKAIGATNMQQARQTSLPHIGMAAFYQNSVLHICTQHIAEGTLTTIDGIKTAPTSYPEALRSCITHTPPTAAVQILHHIHRQLER